jgi:hypothetical protein
MSRVPNVTSGASSEKPSKARSAEARGPSPKWGPIDRVSMEVRFAPP